MFHSQYKDRPANKTTLGSIKGGLNSGILL